MADSVYISALTIDHNEENGTDHFLAKQECPNKEISQEECLSKERSQDECLNEESSQDAGHGDLLRLMRSHLQTLDSSCQEVDDASLERFLAINASDPEKAAEALLEHLKWWRTFAPLGYIPKEEVANEVKRGKICLQGHDKRGRTVGVFLVVRHDSFDRDLEEFKRYAIYSIEKAVASTKNKSKELLVIVDLAGWGYRSVDVRGYLALLEILQEHYINHLGKMILIHAPFIFWAVWKITSPFFNEFTKERMIFVEDQNLQSVLLEVVDEDQLADIYGGKMPLDPA